MNRASLVFALLLAVLVPLSLLAGRVWIVPFGDTPHNAALILAELRLPRAV
ncbi:MAG: ABC transporter permease, partial [Erythrobacter sp.]|nr:ABC transporter permease [Erythrobacter sp.]